MPSDDDIRDRCSTCAISFSYDEYPCHSCSMRDGPPDVDEYDDTDDTRRPNLESYWRPRSYIAELLKYREAGLPSGNAPMLGGNKKQNHNP